MKVFEIVIKTIYYALRTSIVLLMFGFVVLLTFMLGNFFSVWFNINIVICYIVTFILVSLSFINFATDSTGNKGLSPFGYFVLGWLVRK